MYKFIISTVFFFLVSTYGHLAHSSEFNAKINRRPKNTIELLEFETQPPEVEHRFIGEKHEVYVYVKGNYKAKDHSIAFNKNSEVEQGVDSDDSDREFKIRVVLTGPSTLIQAISVSPLGELKKEVIQIQFEGWATFLDFYNPKKMNRHQISPGLLITNQSYSQDFKTSTRQFSLTPKIFYQYVISPGKWNIGANVFMTALNLSVIPTSNKTLKYGGANFRFGYRLPFKTEVWQLDIMSGFYYLTMISAPDSYGFKHLTGPQIFIAFRRLLGQTWAISGYGKLAILSNGFTPTGLSNREIATGLSFSKQIGRNRILSIAADVSLFTFAIKNPYTLVDNNLRLTTQSVGFNYGITF